ATLIGADGRPPRFTWKTTGDIRNAFIAPDGTFSVHHPEHGLLELLPDPKLQRYRFKAEVRHDHGAAIEGAVGIYFCHSEHAAAEQAYHCYWTVAFSDQVDLQKAYNDVKHPGNRLELEVHRHPTSGL